MSDNFDEAALAGGLLNISPERGAELVAQLQAKFLEFVRSGRADEIDQLKMRLQDAHRHQARLLRAESAPTLAREPNILAEFFRVAGLRGLVGEERNAKLIYLAITSRLLSKPVSIGVKGHSSSGKSFTVTVTLDFFPPEAVLTFSSTSEKALIYSDADYQHRTLIMYEITGMREGDEEDLTAYFIRTLLSEGRIDYEVTIRGKDGAFTTKRITKEGPTNLIFTTTKTRVHAENETRILSLNTDDGTEQTKRVIEAMAREAGKPVDLAPWKNLQSWLQTAEHRVTIPFARQLAAAIPPIAIRLRRDFSAVLALIQAHAILHQITRDRDSEGRIVATLNDYAAVRDLVGDVISDGVGATVDDIVRETVRTVNALAGSDGCTVNQVAAELKVDKSNASRRVRRAADGGFIRNLEDKRGRPARWVAGDPLPETVAVLPPPALFLPPQVHATAQLPQEPAQLATATQPETRANAGCCAVAPAQEGKERGANGNATVSATGCPACDGKGCDWCRPCRSNGREPT